VQINGDCRNELELYLKTVNRSKNQQKEKEKKNLDKPASALICAKPQPKVITFTLCLSGGFLVYAVGWLLKSSDVLGFNLGKGNIILCFGSVAL
jgi:hypothetical protein